jgi:hypothetical protein
MDDMAKL